MSSPRQTRVGTCIIESLHRVSTVLSTIVTDALHIAIHSGMWITPEGAPLHVAPGSPL